ncbi:MAG: hypothetical protein CVV61_08050, partial [Tenericutes bacterium HGW-Tenericutes-6]
GKHIDETELNGLIDFVNHRYDCADFRMIVLIKTFLSYKNLLSKETIERISEAILNFKYWMDEPGLDGMCFWSENHQILFHTCEYLAGNIFSNHIFLNDGNLGSIKKEKAKTKIHRWLDYKLKYGFIEWHSNTYYEEDIAPLVMLVDFSDDDLMIEKSKMVLDLLFLDMAMHSYKGYFVATSGRCYEMQKKDIYAHDTSDLMAYAFGIQKKDYDYKRLSTLFILNKNYQVPEVIKKIAKDQSTVIIKDSMGLNLSEIDQEIKNNDIDDKGMLLWQMEAFTNKESIEMTMEIFNAWHLKENNFLKDLNAVNIKPLRKLRLLPLVVKILNPATQGVAIERANTYTYKTKDFMLSTAQGYHPKKFGDQQHIWQATLSSGITIFSTHPGSPMFDDAARNFSPSYFVGNGINPYAIQDENKLFIMYDLSPRKGYLERHRQKFVHFYIPFERFDEVLKMDKKLYLKSMDSYVAIFTSSAYEVKDQEEIIIQGTYSQFVLVLGSKKKHQSFKKFIEELEQSKVVFKKNHILYQDQHTYELKMKKPLKKDNMKIDINYDRFDTPYVKGIRKPESIQIAFDGLSLSHDYKVLKREVKS